MGDRHTETDRMGDRHTETDRMGDRHTETDRMGDRHTETDRMGDRYSPKRFQCDPVRSSAKLAFLSGASGLPGEKGLK